MPGVGATGGTLAPSSGINGKRGTPTPDVGFSPKKAGANTNTGGARAPVVGGQQTATGRRVSVRSPHVKGLAKARAPQPAQQGVNPDLAAILNPSSLPTGQQAARGLQALEQSAYGPQYQQIDQAVADTKTQDAALAKDVGSIYDPSNPNSVAGRGAQDAAAMSARGQQLDTQLAGIGGTARQGMAAGTGAMQANAAQDAAVRGGGLTGGADQALAAEANAGQNQSNLYEQSARQLGAENTANYGDFVRGLASVRAQQGAETQGQLANRESNALNTLEANRESISGKEAADTLRNALTLGQQFRTDLLTGQKVNVPIDVAKINAGAKTQAAGISAGASVDVAKINRDAREAAATISAEARNAAKTRGLTPAEALKYGQQIGNATAQAWFSGSGRSPVKFGKTTLGPHSIETAATYIKQYGASAKTHTALTHLGFSDAEIVLGADIATHGYVLPQNEGLVRQLGANVRIPMRYRAPASAAPAANGPGARP